MSSVRVERRAMATLFEVAATDGACDLRAAAEEALDEIERLEARLSIYLPTSEISAINAAPGPVAVEPGLHALLRRMREIHFATGGAFDGGISTARFGKDTVAASGLDLGGIGKGYAIDRAVELLRARGVTRALVHGGTSTVYAIGEATVGLVDPRDDTRRFGTLALKDQALSVSSNIADRPGHIPAGAHACAWAVAGNATDADAFSTAFLVAGPMEQPGVGCMVLGDELTCLGVTPERIDETRFGFSRRDFMRGTAAVVSLGFLPARRAAAQDKRPLKVAVIGVGEHGRLLLTQLRRMKDVAIPAICDVSDAALKEAIRIVGRDVETYEDAGHLVDEEDVDAVVVATPTNEHKKPVLAALKAGRHVFVEAPLARTAADCRAIAKAAGGKIVHVGHQRRTSKLYPHVLEHVKSGAIGKVVSVRAQWNERRSWRRTAGNWRLARKTSGGLLLEFGSHVFDLMHWYTGLYPVSVSGVGAIAKWKDGRDVDDTVQVVLDYPGGVQLNFGAGLISSHGGEEEVIVGDAASVLVREQRKALLFKESDTALVGWEAYASKEMRDGRRGIILDAMATKYKEGRKKKDLGPDAGKADFFSELERFLAAVRAGKPAPCTARDGLVAAVTALGAERAVKERSVVRFSKEDFEV